MQLAKACFNILCGSKFTEALHQPPNKHQEARFNILCGSKFTEANGKNRRLPGLPTFQYPLRIEIY